MGLKSVPTYIVASVVVSIGGFLNGHDTGSIGAITSMAQFTRSIGLLTPTMLGVTVSLIMLTGAVPSLWAGYLADKFGRLKVVMAGAVVFLLGCILQGTAASLPQFLFGRALGGLGEGIFLSNINVYITEIVPAKSRGALVGLPQFMSTAGVCAGYFTCYGSVHIPTSLAWRAPYVVQAALAVVLALGCLALPDSPRWLMLHGKRPEALQALQRLNFPPVEAEADVLRATDQRLSLSPWKATLLLFKRGYRARTMLALFLLGMAQLSGIDGILYYAPTLFVQAGLSSDTASFLSSGLSAILMLVVSIPSFLLVDRWGRRTSALCGGLGLSFCMLLIGSLYAAGVVHPYGVARWVVIMAIFAFGLTYAATWGIVGKIYASEIQPAHTRATANCVAQGLGFFTNWLVAILTPILLDKSAYGAYFLFGGLAIGTVLVLAECMPETRGQPLESINEAFNQARRSNFSSFMRSLTSHRTTSPGQSGTQDGEQIRLDSQVIRSFSARPL